MKVPKVNLRLKVVLPALLLVLAACSHIEDSPIYTAIHGSISGHRAIELAKEDCSIETIPQENPYNITAEFTTCKNIGLRMPRACDRQPDNLKVWLVSMDGTWFISGPPPESGTPVAPLTVKHCKALINAQTGEIISSSSSR